jgi:hypothetical protein
VSIQEKSKMFKETEIGRIRRNIAALLRRSAMDREFRGRCLENAAEAYWELSGEPLPEKYKVRFAERKDIESGGGSRVGGPPPDEPQVCLLPEFLPPTWLE